jgi:Transposase DDE domain group 1
MQNCTESAQVLQLNFDISGVKKIAGEFSAPELSSDGGLLLVRAADDRLNLSEQIALNLDDKRQSGKVKFSLAEIIRQRMYMIATGNEDVNDADRLASDPMHKICVGSNPETEMDLASDSTIGRLESKRTEGELERLQQLLVHLYIQRLSKTPDKIVLDIDGFSDEVHGQQKLSFYNGFYQMSCYIPLLIVAGTFPLAAILRSGKAGPAEGTVEALKRIVKILRKENPRIKIELRADAGFDEPDIYEYCERNRITYYIGLPSNARVAKKAAYVVDVAKREFADLYGQVEPQKQGRVRVIQDIIYAADTWTVNRRVIVRCDYTAEGSDIRYVLTNHKGGRAKWLYEEKYCKRARCENVIKELRTVSADRLSTQSFESNQFRLLLHVFTYILLNEVRACGQASERHITLNTLKLRLIKVAVQVEETARRIFLRWPSSYPWQQAFVYTAARLKS